MRPIARFYLKRYQLHKIDEEGLNNLATKNVVSSEEKQLILEGE